MKLLRGLRSLLRKRKIEAEMAEEMRLHLEMLEEQNRAAGMSAEEARFAARRAFGGVEQVKEICREQRSWVWLELGIKEVGFALRSLKRAPGFSIAALSTLALCIGPNTAILSVLYALVYQPLPFPEPERLVAITNVAERSGGAKLPSSVAQYQDFKARADCFAGVTYFNSKGAVMGGEDSPVRHNGLEVGDDFFTVLQLQPRFGRFFSADEVTPGKDRVLVLSSAAWESRYGADPSVVGREVRMDGEAYTIVGVAPTSFEAFVNDLEFFRPRALSPGEIDPQARYAGSVQVLARLKPGVTHAAARAQLELLEKTFLEQVATAQTRASVAAGGYRIAVVDARQEMAEPVKTPLLLLQGGGALVLLIGCVNVASLLLARTNTKRLELAVRHALGAGRGALLRQMLAESFLLVGLAGAVGVGFAAGLLQVMNHYLPRFVRHVPPVELDATVLVMVLGVIGVLVVVMGVAPFVLLWRSGLRVGESPTASTGRVGRRAIDALVVGQMAFALVLLVGAALLIHSFARVMAVSPGFDAEQVIQGRVNLPKSRYPGAKERIAAQQRMLASMREIPGVEAVSLSLDFGVAPSFRPAPFLIRGGSAGGSNERRALVYRNAVSAEFFKTMGIRLLSGRSFDEGGAMTAPVAVVDQAFAERYFPGGDAVGQELVLGAEPPEAGHAWTRIVGVVARANLAGREGRDGWPFVYVPFNQIPAGSFSFLVRSPRLSHEVIDEMRARLRAIDPGLPLYSAGTLASGLDAMLGNRRALLWLLSGFAALAFALAAVGLYGVLNYDVSQRTREIGIRSAIGATSRQIKLMILRQGMGKAGLGLIGGLLGAFMFTRVLRKMLFDVSPTDPVSYVAVALLLLLVALVACWLPARRAARVDPMVALRAE